MGLSQQEGNHLGSGGFFADKATCASYIAAMSTSEILELLPKLTKRDREEIRLKLAEIDGDAWLDAEDPLTDGEKAILEARLAAYEKDADAGSTWDEVEARIHARLQR